MAKLGRLWATLQSHQPAGLRHVAIRFSMILHSVLWATSHVIVSVIIVCRHRLPRRKLNGLPSADIVHHRANCTLHSLA